MLTALVISFLLLVVKLWGGWPIPWIVVAAPPLAAIGIFLLIRLLEQIDGTKQELGFFDAMLAVVFIIAVTLGVAPFL